MQGARRSHSAPSPLAGHRPCLGARRQRRWRRAGRQHQWRRAKGLFPEFFPSGSICEKLSKKRPNYKKFGRRYSIYMCISLDASCTYMYFGSMTETCMSMQHYSPHAQGLESCMMLYELQTDEGY